MRRIRLRKVTNCIRSEINKKEPESESEWLDKDLSRVAYWIGSRNHTRFILAMRIANFNWTYIRRLDGFVSSLVLYWIGICKQKAYSMIP